MADFTVLEDGKPQKIEAFSEINVPDPVEPPAKWMKRTSPDVATNDLHESRIVVIVLDDAVIPDDPMFTKSVKDIGRQIVGHLSPNDLATVVYTLANRQKAQDFTNDHAKLLAAVEKYTPGFNRYGVGGRDEYLFYQYSENVVHDAAEFLIALPNRRKTLIYLSSGVPVDPGALAPVLIGSGAPVGGREGMVRLNEDLRELIMRAQRANVTIYPIDASGLNGVENFVNAECMRVLGHTCEENAHKQQNLSLDFLLENADNTGGRATVNTNDFTEGITQIFRENGSYYLLGYRQTNPKGPNSYSRLDVRVNRKDVEVRSRHINYTPKEDKALSRAPAVVRDMAGLLPDPETPLRVSVAPFAHRGAYAKGDAKDEATVAIVLGVKVTAPATRVTEHVNMLTRAFDMEGGDRGAQAQKADVTLRPAAAGANADDAGRYEVLSQISLRPGRYQLRLATDNESRDLGGSVFVDVEVPDFGKAPLSLSGVVLESRPAPVTAPLDALKGLIPVIPTTQREFATTDRVGAFLRVYQGGKAPFQAVTVATTILDVNDASVFTSTTVLNPDRFTPERDANIAFNLPLDMLKPGPHLLVFQATAGNATAKREVVFSVK